MKELNVSAMQFMRAATMEATTSSTTPVGTVTTLTSTTATIANLNATTSVVGTTTVTGLKLAFQTGTLDVVATSAMYGIQVDPTGAAKTVTLPAASAHAGRVYVISDKATGNNLTITPNGSDTVDGSATLVLNAAKECATIMSDGVSNWILIVNVGIS